MIIVGQILLILRNIHYRLYKSFDIYPSLSAEKGVTDICGAFLNFNSPKVPQKWAVFSLFGGVWRLEKIMLLLEIYLLCGNFGEIGLLMSVRVKIISIKQEALNTPCVCCMLVALSLNSGGVIANVGKYLF